MVMRSAEGQPTFPGAPVAGKLPGAGPSPPSLPSSFSGLAWLDHTWDRGHLCPLFSACSCLGHPGHSSTPRQVRASRLPCKEGPSAEALGDVSPDSRCGGETELPCKGRFSPALAGWIRRSAPGPWAAQWAEPRRGGRTARPEEQGGDPVPGRHPQASPCPFGLPLLGWGSLPAIEEPLASPALGPGDLDPTPMCPQKLKGPCGMGPDLGFLPPRQA